MERQTRQAAVIAADSIADILTPSGEESQSPASNPDSPDYTEDVQPVESSESNGSNGEILDANNETNNEIEDNGDETDANNNQAGGVTAQPLDNEIIPKKPEVDFDPNVVVKVDQNHLVGQLLRIPQN